MKKNFRNQRTLPRRKVTKRSLRADLREQIACTSNGRGTLFDPFPRIAGGVNCLAIVSIDLCKLYFFSCFLCLLFRRLCEVCRTCGLSVSLAEPDKDETGPTAAAQSPDTTTRPGFCVEDSPHVTHSSPLSACDGAMKRCTWSLLHVENHPDFPQGSTLLNLLLPSSG